MIFGLRKPRWPGWANPPVRRYPGVVMRLRRFVSGILLALAGACSGQAEDFFFNSAGVRVHYTVEGEGEPVVLMHG